MRLIILLLPLSLAACAQSARGGGACDQWLRQTVRATGTYLPAEEPYARSYVFALDLDCNGKLERVTVERGTGNLPICQTGQQVEVTGRLAWNRALVAGHYEINNPQSVICH
ncbi:MAG TPA: hypothetical protein VGU20_02830 [Stellaceae bacterium]|nr:hypothetical protein [Stellaceae bacterium]